MKTQKDLRLGVYLDAYEGLLTPKQVMAARLYYEEDMSLSEVASEMRVTRQGVLDTLTRARKRLYALEDQLGLVGHGEGAGDGI